MESNAFFTGIVHRLCGYEVPVYVKTGLYTGLAPGGHGFRDIKNPDSTFGVHGDFFSPDEIGLKIDHKASILLFYQKGPLFFIYNHETQRFRSWSMSLNDLANHYLETRSYQDEIQLQRCIAVEAERFADSDFLRQCRNYLSNLNDQPGKSGSSGGPKSEHSAPLGTINPSDSGSAPAHHSGSDQVDEDRTDNSSDNRYPGSSFRNPSKDDPGWEFPNAGLQDFPGDDPSLN